MKNSEFVSRVVNNIRTLNKDNHISKRFILNLGRTKSAFYMSQKLDELTLYNETGILTNINCVAMVPMDIVKCDIVEFRTCKSLMRSKKQLPEFIEGKIGPAIFMVTSIDTDNPITYKFKNLNVLNRNNKRRHSKAVTKNYFTIKDRYLYLANSTNEMVNVSLVTLDKYHADKLSTCEDSDCKSAWEKEFVCPNRFLDRVLQETESTIANIYRTSAVDENPNQDEHQKSQTTN